MSNRHLAAMQSATLYERESSVEDVARRCGIDAGRVLDFSLNINPFGPPPRSREAARGALDRAHEYPDVGLAGLRRRVAAWHGVPGDALVFGDGLDEVIKLLVHAWTDEGDRVLIHIPTFPRYELEVGARGAVPVLVRSDPPWAPDLAAMARALEAAPTALAFLCTPNNPTSAEIATADIERLAAGFPATMFVVDEALIFPPEVGAAPLLAGRRNVAVLRTFSKYFGLAGLRVGYAVADPARLALVEMVRPPFNVSGLAAAAAVAAMDDGEFLESSRRAFHREAAFLRDALGGLDGCRIHGGDSNMLLLALEGVSSPALVEALVRRGILVVDGRTFNGLEDRDTIRVSIRDRAANEALAHALRAVWPGLRGRSDG